MYNDRLRRYLHQLLAQWPPAEGLNMEVEIPDLGPFVVYKMLQFIYERNPAEIYVRRKMSTLRYANRRLQALDNDNLLQLLDAALSYEVDSLLAVRVSHHLPDCRLNSLPLFLRFSSLWWPSAC